MVKSVLKISIPYTPMGARRRTGWRERNAYTSPNLRRYRRLSDALARSLQSQRSRSKKGLVFGRKKSMYVDVRMR